MNAPPDPVERFITRWQGREGGQERANYGLFLSELCDAIGVARPQPASATTAENDYVFERSVKEMAPDGAAGTGRIDLYKKGCFVLEAKQSRQPGGKKEIAAQPELFPRAEPRLGARSAARAWDVLMRNARVQAERYARALPVDHGWPPFILICDVGHVIEVYADFSGQGKNYAQFPDRQSFRVYLEDLRRGDIRELLAHIWTDPLMLDPARKTARVTRAIAERLAAVSKALEEQHHDPEEVAMFLMRCLFTMFAEDVELLPRNSFRDLLKRCEEDPSRSGRWSANYGRQWTRVTSPMLWRPRCGASTASSSKPAPCFPWAARKSANCGRLRRITGAMSIPRSSARCWNKRSTRENAAGWARITHRALTWSGWSSPR
ncbi:MAG: type IIL restriction-modification enzyme MmeI [Acetobacteraceae bacterium]